MCGVFPYRKGRGSRDESYCFTKGMKEAREGWTKLGKKRYNYLPSIFHSLKNRGDSTGNVRQHFCRIWNIHSWNIKQMLASNNKKKPLWYWNICLRYWKILELQQKSLVPCRKYRLYADTSPDPEISWTTDVQMAYDSRKCISQIILFNS